MGRVGLKSTMSLSRCSDWHRVLVTDDCCIKYGLGQSGLVPEHLVDSLNRRAGRRRDDGSPRGCEATSRKRRRAAFWIVERLRLALLLPAAGIVLTDTLDISTHCI